MEGDEGMGRGGVNVPSPARFHGGSDEVISRDAYQDMSCLISLQESLCLHAELEENHLHQLAELMSSLEVQQATDVEGTQASGSEQPVGFSEKPGPGMFLSLLPRPQAPGWWGAFVGGWAPWP